MTQSPPDGFRVATSTREVFDAHQHARRSTNRRNPHALRVYVDQQWVPGSVDSAIDAVPRRPVTRNVPMTWGEPPFGDARRLPFDRIAIPIPEGKENTIDELVDVLLDSHMLVEVADAVRDDDQYEVLAQVCSTLSSGEAGTIGLVFGEVSDILDADAAALRAVLDADSPAAALADLVRQHHDSIRPVT